MSAPFTQGQEVFDIRGRAGSYVAPSAHGHLVEPIYDHDDDEPHYGHAETWPEVFATPPRERLASDLADLLGEITDGQAKLRAVQNEVHAIEQVKRDVTRRAKAEPQLADLHLWLEGKVTHIVALNYYSIEVGTVDEVLRSNDRERQLRLLSLYVDPKANEFWVGRAAYSDGSSSVTRCRLATSEWHAREIAREYIAQMLQDSNQVNSRTTWLRLAIKFDMAITDADADLLLKYEIAGAARILEQAKDSHVRAAAALAEAERAFKEVNGGAA